MESGAHGLRFQNERRLQWQGGLAADSMARHMRSGATSPPVLTGTHSFVPIAINVLKTESVNELARLWKQCSNIFNTKIYNYIFYLYDWYVCNLIHMKYTHIFLKFMNIIINEKKSFFNFKMGPTVSIE